MFNPLEAAMGWLRNRHYREMERAQARIDAALARQADVLRRDQQALNQSLRHAVETQSSAVERAAAGAPVDIAEAFDDAMCGCAHCILTREPGL